MKKADSCYYVLCVGWRIIVLRLYDWWTREGSGVLSVQVITGSRVCKRLLLI
jgi:hypothetical protein